MPIDLLILTPGGESFRGPVDGVVLPGSEGDFGVLPSHERFLSPLRVGEVEIRTPSDTLWAAIASGFAEVNGAEVVVLVESCELDHEIDVAKAVLEHERAKQGLAELGDDQAHRIRDYEEALELAKARISVARKA